MHKIYIAKDKIGSEYDVAAFSYSKDFVKAYIFLNPKAELTFDVLHLEDRDEFVHFMRTYRGLELEILADEVDGKKNDDRCIVLTKHEKDELDRYKRDNCDELVDYASAMNVMRQLKPEYADLLKRVGYYYVAEISRLTGDIYDLRHTSYSMAETEMKYMYNAYKSNINVDVIKLKYFVESYNGSWDELAGHSLNVERRMSTGERWR